MGASTIVLAVISPINVALNIALIHYTTLGLLGSPVALSITYWLSFFLLMLITYVSPSHTRNGTWGGIQPTTVMDIRSCFLFLKLAVPGILMVGTEWSVFKPLNWNVMLIIVSRAAFEIVALAAGRLGPLPLAAQSVIMTTDQSKADLKII